jgi:hypothetical protein
LEPVQSSADVRPTSISSAIGFFCDAACARTPDKVAIIDLFGEREREVTYRLTTAAAAFSDVLCQAPRARLGRSSRASVKLIS